MRFLQAVAIYNYPSVNKPEKPTLINHSQQSSGTSLFSESPLRDFENQTYTQLPETLKDGSIYTNQIGTTFHYIKKLPNDNFFMVLCSRNKLLPFEIINLFANLRHAQLRPQVVNINDMIKNPLAYTGKDHLIANVQQKIQTAKEMMMDNIDLALAKQNKIDDLVAKSNQLHLEAAHFDEQGRKLNRCCSIG